MSPDPPITNLNFGAMIYLSFWQLFVTKFWRQFSAHVSSFPVWLNDSLENRILGWRTKRTFQQKNLNFYRTNILQMVRNYLEITY